MADGNDVSREHLAELLNEDLAREYQAIIGYVVYSQVLSGAQYMDIAAQLEIHAKQELDHALIISRQIDYLGKMPAVNVTPRQSPEGSFASHSAALPVHHYPTIERLLSSPKRTRRARTLCRRSVNRAAILEKEEELMGTTTLAATLNTPMSELRPATMDRILVIEDDSALRKILQRLFSSEGYEVEVVPDSVAGLERLRQRPFSAVILDLQHPGSSGCDLCRKIADLTSGLPLVILSASPDVADKVLLLEMGADDYVTIPFSPRELVARLRALIRRAPRFSPEGADIYVYADVMVDFSKTEITRGGEKIAVTPMEFKTLEFLAKNAERVISRDELLNEVWGYQNYPCTRTVDNHILRLRQKLESDPSHPSHLLTVHGMGYKFVP